MKKLRILSLFLCFVLVINNFCLAEEVKNDIEDTKEVIMTLDEAVTYALKNNAVVTIRCEESLVETLRNTLNSISNIVDYRVISYKKEHSGEQGKIDSTSLNNIDYLEQFTDFILNHIGSDEIVKEELSAIIGG